MTQGHESIFFVMLCDECGWQVFVEAGGLADPPWDGKCPKCRMNVWNYIRQTTDKTEGLGAAMRDLGARAVFRVK